MIENNMDLAAGIKLTETVDGIPVGELEKAAPAKKKRSGAARTSDTYIWGLYIFIMIVSIIELYSASSSEVTSKSLYGPLISHMKFLVAGFFIVLWFQNRHYKVFRKWAWVVAGICLALLVYSFMFGLNINGAQRAIGLPGGFTLQPAEMAKLAVVLILARIIAKNQMKGGITNRGIVLSVAVITVFSIFLFRNGLTNFLLLAIVAVSMLIIGVIQWRKFLILFGSLAVIGGIFVAAKILMPDNSSEEFDAIGGTNTPKREKVDRTETRKERIKSFIRGVSPDDKLTDDNRQVMFSKIAQAHGGLTGNGPGNSRESARLPLAFSDYIYSIIVEDTGFIGGVGLLLLYLFIALRAGTVASKCSRAFPALLIMGCAVLIVTQALVHMGIAVGVLPVSGQPLPFISKGGTSIIVMSCAIGMMLSVSRFAVKGNNRKEVNKEIRELPEDMRAANPMQYNV